MNILIFMTGGFDNHGPSNHLYGSLIEDFLSAGNKVHLIESLSTGKNPSLPIQLANKSNLTYELVKSKLVQKNKFAQRYLNSLIYSYKSRKALKKSGKPDIVLIQSCPTAFFQLNSVKRFFDCPIVYNIQDMFPGSSIYSGIMRKKWMQTFFYALQKKAYKKADHITVISEDSKTKLLEQGVSNEKISVIVNWYDDKSVHEIEWAENRFVAKYNLQQNKFYIQYAGTMGFVFDFDKIIQTAVALQKYSNIEFHMIGEGSQKAQFIRKAQQLNLSNIRFFPLEPQDMVSDVYSSCSIQLIPLKRGIIGNSVPSKAALLMACRRTIVNSVDENSDYYNMFNRENIGIAVSNISTPDLVKVILKLYQNDSVRVTLAENGQRYGALHYSRSVNTKKYINLFETLIKEK